MNKLKVSFTTKILGVNADFWVVVFFFILFSFLYSILAIIRHNHFQSQGIDFSIYDQSLWLYSRFEKPYSTITNLVDLADRFRPIMIPLSWLYFFSDNERVILLFQSVILSSAIFPIWLIARCQLPKILAIIIAFLYVDFIGIQSAVVYDFHEMSLLPLFLAWCFYFLHREKWRNYFLLLFLSLSVREHVGFLLSTFGIYIWVVKRNIKIASFTTVISLVWSISAIKFIMPVIGQQEYKSFVHEGDTLASALLAYFVNPSSVFNNFFLPLQKGQTLFWSYFSFGMSPLLYLPIFPAIAYQFASRFLDQLHPIRWTLYFHYSVELAVLLAVSATFNIKITLGKLKRFKHSLLAISLLLIVTHTITNAALNSPLKLILKPDFYKRESWMKDTSFILSKVPKDASVAAQNNLLPHLSHRRKVYLLPNVNNADYLLVDLHPGQNDWNFYNQNIEKTKLLIKQIIEKGYYKPILSSGNVYLLKKS